ncbi:hypothetical protein DQW50_16420 [Halorubrum sp. 48-1-W]|uniref:hypothetical protein n=1 Tax=Halorubrum sp. 48-1-W TaxID=2249761 RepID=UPI000DCAF5B8|nr:hypothetical protein [Halorubrum sp. 48-1-W]RAW44042.1 hypothetical protein DQW50_16420 [Halorubrum sp. 48-1-W]
MDLQIVLLAVSSISGTIVAILKMFEKLTEDDSEDDDDDDDGENNGGWGPGSVEFLPVQEFSKTH